MSPPFRFTQDELRVLHAEACALAAAAFGVTLDALLTDRRWGDGKAMPLFARRIAMYLMRLNEAPHDHIATLFGMRSPSTVYRALAAIEDARDDPALDAQLDALEITLRRRLAEGRANGVKAQD